MSVAAAPPANSSEPRNLARSAALNIPLRIAREEWRAMARDKVAVVGLVLLTLLSMLAALTSFDYQRQVNAEREHHQAEADQQFANQPDRHPHRVVHYGHFVFRPLNALAVFDPGVDAYTGHALFLEGHRQNGANFSDVRQSSLLIRFGQLTPAFILQAIAPLLLIFVGHGALARERERGTLRVLLAQGVSARQIVCGKLLAVAGVAALALLPALLALFGSAAALGAPLLPLAIMAAAYSGWMLVAALTVVLVSARLARSRDALLALLAIWAISVILIPRAAPDLANSVLALPTRFESMIAVEHDLKALGDSHNPDDPYFAAFKAKVLRQYGVASVAELPVNYKGLVAVEGERLTSELFKRYADASFALQQQQSRLVDAFGIVSPVLALRRLSMSAAGTDLASYRNFLEQGEDYRYRLVQRLNTLQAEKLSFATDGKAGHENRIDRANWQAVPPFVYQAQPASGMLRSAAPAAAMLALWLAALALLTRLAVRRLGSSIQ